MDFAEVDVYLLKQNNPDALLRVALDQMPGDYLQPHSLRLPAILRGSRALVPIIR